jgi:predicted anti-sigma-YlaC factor YlaD
VNQEEIRCIEMVEVVTDWMEGALDDDSRAAVEEHLAICPDCVGYLDQLRTATTLAARLVADGTDMPPASVRARLVAAYEASRPPRPGPPSG